MGYLAIGFYNPLVVDLGCLELMENDRDQIHAVT